TMNTKSAAYSFSYKVGTELFLVYGSANISALVDWEGLDQKVAERKTLGTIYLNALDALPEKEDYLLDYNQIQNANAGLNKFSQNIHQINQTADNYSVSGQGMSGSFKPYLG